MGVEVARFITSRVIRTALTIFVVLSLAFVLARLTGDPVRLMLPQDATQADVDAMRATLGLDRPLWEQYVSFLGGAVQGDMGDSIRQGVVVIAIVFVAINLVVDMLYAALDPRVRLAR